MIETTEVSFKPQYELSVAPHLQWLEVQVSRRVVLMRCRVSSLMRDVDRAGVM